MEQPVNKSILIVKPVFGFYVSLATAIVTTATFAIAIMTPPLSGPWCTGNCFEYPFTDIASRFPRDYFWMYPAILVSVLFIMLTSVIHHYADESKKLFTQIGMSFATISAVILILNYFVQVSVVQPSLLNEETDGISLISQFNPHGVFIASEEIGFLLMTLAMFFMYPTFNSDRLSKAIRIVLITGFPLAVLSLILISLNYGLKREYMFEIAVISIVWIELIISSVLICILYRRQL